MATATLTASGNWSDAIWSGGNGPGGSPADGDSVITGEFNVLMNVDLSAWTGLLDVTVSSGAVTPGMIYFKDGTSGYLKIRSGYSLKGTSGTVLGRVLANSDGVWGNVGSLAYTNKAVVDWQGTAQLTATYLDLAFYDTRPDHTFVETYGLAYTCTDQTTDVNVGTDVITFASAPPAAGTAVIVRSSGTLPGGLLATDVYYIRAVSGNTCKLALQNSDATIVDITSTGSGTLTMYTGHTSTSTATMNIIQDISADPQWTTTTGHNRVILVDSNAPEDYDQQRVTIAGKTASTITLSENVNSAQYPGAKIFLLSSNVSLRSTGATTSQVIIDFSSAQARSGVFQCEIVNTTGTGTTFNGYGISGGTGHTISGTVSGCYYGVVNIWGSTISGIIAGCSNGIRSGYRNTISGTVSGCVYGLIFSSGNTVSGVISGCNQGAPYCSCNTFSGVVSGCNNGFAYCTGNNFSGTISGCSTGINYCANTLVSGTISGCANGTYYGSCRFTSGTISGCTNGSYYTDFTGVGLILSGNANDVAYLGVYTAPLTNGRSFTHAGTANDTRAWSAGGVMTHETTIVPTGKSYSHKFTHVDDDYWTLMQWEISRVEALTVSITVHAKHDVTSLAADERIHWQLIDPNGNDPLVDAGAVLLDEFIAADSTDWQSDTLSTTRTDDRPLIVRACAKRGSGNSYIYLEPIVAGAGGGLPVLGGSIVR